MAIPKQTQLQAAIENHVIEGNLITVTREQLDDFAVQHFLIDKAELAQTFENSKQPVVETRLSKAISSLVKKGVLVDAGNDAYHIGVETRSQQERDKDESNGAAEEARQRSANRIPNGEESSNNPVQHESSAAIHWISNNQRIGIALVGVLIFFYMAPMVLLAIAAWKTDSFEEESNLIRWVSAFLKLSNSTYTNLQTILSSLIAGVSIVSFRDRPATEVAILFGVFLLAFVFTKVLQTYFAIDEIQEPFKRLRDAPTIEMLTMYFSRVEEALITYFLMLGGITVSNKMAGK